MKCIVRLRKPLADAAWLAVCIAVVWNGRFYVSSAMAMVSQKSRAELVEASRAHLPNDAAFATRLANAALDRTKEIVRYDGGYTKISYPNGDVPAGTGVCTDEVIRTYRKVGFDLQKLVHEDMAAHFEVYPKQWKLPKPDSNIDHRRVPNLQTFLKRQGAALPVSKNPEDYVPGDLITCNLPGNLTHIALVVPAPNGGPHPWIVHNIGEGPQMEDRLFEFELTGHYRWHPAK
jgi:uncharacterized protein YijF (DUF1287 family)